MGLAGGSADISHIRRKQLQGKCSGEEGRPPRRGSAVGEVGVSASPVTGGGAQARVPKEEAGWMVARRSLPQEADLGGEGSASTGS